MRLAAAALQRLIASDSGRGHDQVWSWQEEPFALPAERAIFPREVVAEGDALPCLCREDRRRLECLHCRANGRCVGILRDRGDKPVALIVTAEESRFFDGRR